MKYKPPCKWPASTSEASLRGGWGGGQGGEGQATPAALDDHNLVPGSIHVASSGSIQNTKFTTKYKIHNRRQTHKI